MVKLYGVTLVRPLIKPTDRSHPVYRYGVLAETRQEAIERAIKEHGWNSRADYHTVGANVVENGIVGAATSFTTLPRAIVNSLKEDFTKEDLAETIG